MSILDKYFVVMIMIQLRKNTPLIIGEGCPAHRVALETLFFAPEFVISNDLKKQRMKIVVRYFLIAPS